MAAFALLVFVAGLISFLSPCVLPLVPGYVSMLSGLGVDQLKEGEGSTGKLLGSASAFVIGFSAVFITMGATASAVGQFLLKNRNLLAPIAAHSLFNTANLVLLHFEEPVNQFLQKFEHVLHLT